jgi:Zn-dependent peptidase ImmA (M78 family)
VPEISTLRAARRLPDTELFADAFAGAFLMPGAGLQRRFEAIRRAKNAPITPADVIELAQLYGVSFQAMTLRLEGLGLLPSGTWDRLRDMGFKPESARKLLDRYKDEPDSSSVPSRFAALAVQAIERDLLSEAQVARRLGTDIVGVRALVEALTTEPSVSPNGEWQQIELDLSEPLLSSGRG